MAFSQSGDTLTRELVVDFEVRPRAEFKDNLMLVKTDTIMPEFFVTQRNRINFTYTSSRFKFHASPQEIHVWGKSGNISSIGSINAFEFYAEPSLTRHFSMRIGRQSLSLDNGRIFSAAPWSQQGRAHEGVRFIYNKKVTTDLTIAFTRPYGKLFDAAYSPVASHQYKFLVVHHLKQKVSNRFQVTTINTLEFFQKKGENGEFYERVTNGGRLDYTHTQAFATVNAYYQYGTNASSKKIGAFYIQPEIGTNIQKSTIRFGAEIISGTKANARSEVSNSFVPLYGVAWKFMGNMNLFTRFPADLNDKGLINPYLFLIYRMSKKLSLRADSHLFFSQHELSESKDERKGKYLGFENDVSMNFKPADKVEIIFGFSSTFAHKRMELLGKIPDANKAAIWSYLMVSYALRLIHTKK